MIVITLVIAAFESSMKEVNLYIDYLKTIQTKEELIGKNNPNIIDILHNCLLHIRQPNYFLGKLLEQNLMEVNCDNNDQSSYFIHYQTKEEIRPTYNFNKRSYDDFIIDNYDELSKNDWELHKQLIKEGINPNEISKIIRNDEIEKLQEIASQTEFDFNQKIKPSLYERCSFINEEYVTLIDYAAFFGSVKCFKYLLINGANMINTGKYAVAGANTEIIHLCEQNHSSLKYIYETAIRLHRNYIFHYFYDNKIIEINDLGELINKCIQYSNYEILSFLEESLEDEDIEITNSRINTCIIHGNLYLLQKYYKNNYNFDKIFSYIKFENPEIIEFLFQQKCIKSSTTTKIFL